MSCMENCLGLSLGFFKWTFRNSKGFFLLFKDAWKRLWPISWILKIRIVWGHWECYKDSPDLFVNFFKKES